MRDFIMKRVTSKDWMQNTLITVVSELIIMAVGLVLGYYFKVYVIGV